MRATAAAAAEQNSNLCVRNACTYLTQEHTTTTTPSDIICAGCFDVRQTQISLALTLGGNCKSAAVRREERASYLCDCDVRFRCVSSSGIEQHNNTDLVLLFIPFAILAYFEHE